MRIERIELKHFGRFSEAAYDFVPGLNLVTGPNEAGKSTLMAAIPAVLFGLRDKERFRPWGREGECSASLRFRTEQGHTIRIDREILSDRVVLTESAADGTLRLSFEGRIAPLGRSSERAIYLEHLDRYIGHADEALFRASLYFAQGSLEIDAPGEIADRIKALLSGCAEVDYDQVLSSLSDDYFAVTSENPWGKDKTRPRELEEVRRRLKELETLWYAGQGNIEAQEALKADIAIVRDEIAEKRGQVAEGKRYLDWVRRQWQLAERETTLRKDFSRVQKSASKVEDLQSELIALQREVGKTGLPVEIPEALPHLLNSAEAIRKELIVLQEETTRLRRERSRLGEAPWKPAVVLSALVLLGFGLAGKGAPIWLAIGGGGSVLIWGVFIYRLLRLNTARAALDGQLDQLQQRRGDALAALAEIEESVRCLGLPGSAVEMVKMEKSLDRHRTLILRIREVQSALQVLEAPDVIAGEEQILTRELAVLAERREHDRPPRAELLRPEDLPEAETKLAALEAAIVVAEERLLTLTRREAEVRGENSIDPLRIEEEGDALREREAFLLRRKAALSLACDMLRGAVDDFRHSHVDRFSQEIGQTLAQITRNRYQAVRLDETFNSQVQVRDDLWQGVERFSRGAQDAVFFAVRLALTRHLTRGRHLPLLLDDPFVHLDKNRLAEMVKLLERIAVEHQLILFSHSDSLLQRAEKGGWRVIPLGETLSRSTIAPVTKSKEKEKSVDDPNQLSLL